MVGSVSATFLTLVSGIRNNKKIWNGINIPVHISEGLVTIFELKILKFFVADPDPGSVPFQTLSGIREGKIRIRDKRFGSATLSQANVLRLFRPQKFFLHSLRSCLFV